jgi:hypothetical protein
VFKNGLCAIDVVGDSATKPTIKQNNFRRSLLIGARVLTLRGQAAVTAAIARNIGSARLLIESAVAAITCLRIFPAPDVSSKVESLSTTAVLVLLRLVRNCINRLGASKIRRDFREATPLAWSGWLICRVRRRPTALIRGQRSGRDARQAIRSYVRLPITMMTGYGDIPMSVRATKLGALDFLPKPFKQQDMLDAVMTAIETDRRRRAFDGALSGLEERLPSCPTNRACTSVAAWLGAVPSSHTVG